MFLIASRTVVGASILLIIPLIAQISGWQWQPRQEAWWINILFWITETVTQPWGIITHVMLCAWFLWCLRFCLRFTIISFIIISCVIIFGQGIKLYAKEYVQELRPCIIWLENTHNIPVSKFLTLEHKLRIQLIKEQLTEQHNIPVFLRRHWQKETEFAFPSGHTMFATSWALLAVNLLWSQHRTLTIIFLLVWATCVISSRLLLGMHWSHDIIVATLISSLLVTFASWLVQCICKHITP